MSEERTVKKVFKNSAEERLPVRWLGDVENHVQKIGGRDWRKIIEDTDAWKLFLEKVIVLHGP
jgi:hypothetical protein